MSAYLGQEHRVPPLPGHDRESGMQDGALVDQVLDSEPLTVESLEGFGLSLVYYPVFLF